MDKRNRVLVVEDVDTMRETWAAILDLNGYRVDSAASATEAFERIDQICYDVALVDIMLAGPDDITNRDGARVLEYIKRMKDWTHALVLSGQEHDVTLARDLLLDLDAFDYLSKRNVEEKGNDYLLEKVDSSIPKIPKLKWEQVSKYLLRDSPEEKFVSDCMAKLQFSGGFENLSGSLLASMERLDPLVCKVGEVNPIEYFPEENCFGGTYWSRGQGKAVEFSISGKNSSRETSRSTAISPARKMLYSRTKAGLSVVITDLPELGRDHFSRIG